MTLFQGEMNGKYALAEVTCAKEADFGVNDQVYETMTHLGNILSPGDTVAGYDLSCSVINEDDLKPLKGKLLPDIVLVKKVYPDAKKKRRQKRKFKLKTLEKTTVPAKSRQDEEMEAMDEEMFLQEIEEDTDLRSRINLYSRDVAATAVSETEDEDGAAFPEIRLDELISDLHIGDDTMPTSSSVPAVEDTISPGEVGKKRRNDFSAFDDAA